jgi:RNA polymerase sigma factor (sigma-70 family)
MPNDDLTLLREYSRSQSEPAFATLVSRHVNLVYSVAMRQVREPHLAGEITQAVFIILARKADKFDGKTILSAWLCRTARYVGARALRTEFRRQRREQEAYMQSTLNEPEPDVWRQIAPLLDNALARLGQRDHDAIVLRFFENKSLGEVGLAIGTSEDTARMRVNRALEKLRKFFAKRGVDSTTATIAEQISANSVQAAPVALAKTVTAVAIAKGAAASASTLTLIKGALKIMAWTQAKPFIVVGVTVILVTGTTILVAQNQLQTNSTIPSNSTIPTSVKTLKLAYKIFDAAFQFSDSAGADKTKLNSLVVVTVDNKEAHPRDINLTIQSSTEGTIALQLGGRGNILNFPQNEQLRRENPDVIIKLHGTAFGLILKSYLPLPENLTFPYRLLGDGVAEDNKISKYVNANTKPSSHVRIAHGVTFYFPKSSAGKAKLEIATAAGRREYTADAEGQIYLKLDNTLLKENPEVTVSEKPQSIWPN